MLLPRFEQDAPAWIEQWVTFLLDKRGYFQWSWIRRLMKAGVIARPETDNYIRKMPMDVASLRADPDVLQDEVFCLFRLLPPDKGALIQPSDIEGADHPEYATQYVSGSLRQLASEGLIDRGRLLTASLEALRIGRKPIDCTWFYRFHELLKLTLDERAALQAAYCDLLTNSVPAVATFALDALGELANASRLDVAGFLTSVERVFDLPTKGTGVAALKLLAQAGKADESIKPDIALVAAAGLGHETPDIQKAALGVLEGLKLAPDERVAAAIASRLDTMAASMKDRARKLLAKLGTASDSEKTVAASRRNTGQVGDSPRSGEAWLRSEPSTQSNVSADPLLSESRLSDVKAIVPIQTLDELIESASAIIEKFSDADEVERLLDGLSRLCNQRPDDFAARTAPFQKRMEVLRKNGAHPAEIEIDVLGRLMQVFRTWLYGAPGPRATADSDDEVEAAPVPPRIHVEPSAAELATAHANTSRRGWPLSLSKRLSSQPVLTFLDGRLSELSNRLRKCDARPLLAAPTHRGGWVSAKAFVERLRFFEQQQLDPQSFDLRQALLRFAPESRDEVLTAAMGLTGLRQRAIEWALDKHKPTDVKEAVVYVAAKAGRDPFAPMLASDNPPVLEPLTFTWKVVRQLPAGDSNQPRWGLTIVPNLNPFENPQFRIPPVSLCVVANRADDAYWSEGKASCLAQVWPINPAPFFAAGAAAVVSDLETTNNDVRHYPEFLKPMFDSHAPFSEMAQLLLAVSLQAKSADQRGLAVDALIAVMADGRCLGEELGIIFRQLLPSGMVRCNRLADPFAIASRASPPHMFACSQIVQTMFGEIDSLSDDAYHLLIPLLDWLVELNRPLQDPIRQTLSKLSGTTKSAKLARSLLKR
ncbi:MAG: hypothetical protein IAG10_20560 [Planctomycetaceae bacterium]|nr:hypothetical protein [Planctomycetaceae bacterium]